MRYDSYTFTIGSNDQHCNSIKIHILLSNSTFLENINLYDFVSIKKLLKEGKTMS